MEEHTLTFRMPGQPLRTVRGAWAAVSELFTILVDAGATDLAISSETAAEPARECPCSCSPGTQCSCTGCDCTHHR